VPWFARAVVRPRRGSPVQWFDRAVIARAVVRPQVDDGAKELRGWCRGSTVQWFDRAVVRPGSGSTEGR